MTPSHTSQALVRAIEALLFAADRPLDASTLEYMLNASSRDEVEAALAQLRQRHDGVRSGLVLVDVAGGFQLRTAPDLGPLVARLREAKPARLSQPALETLSIIAYRQPVTTSELSELRGVDSSGVVKTLIDLNIVRVVGRRETPGRPRLLGTSPRFLSLFGLHSLDDLPTILEGGQENEPPPLLRTPDDGPISTGLGLGGGAVVVEETSSDANDDPVTSPDANDDPETSPDAGDGAFTDTPLSPNADVHSAS